MSMLTVPPPSPVQGLEPRFSSNRHRPHTRLNDWHSIDYDEEIFTELSYCNRTFSNNSIVSAAADFILDDFTSLKHRTQSTSTPFIPRASVGSTLTGFKTPTKRLPIVHEIFKNDFTFQHCSPLKIAADSGYSELEDGVISTFVDSCKIVSPCAGSDGGHDKCVAQSELASDCDLFTAPLPCISLEFDSSSDEEESSRNYIINHKQASQGEIKVKQLFKTKVESSVYVKDECMDTSLNLDSIEKDGECFQPLKRRRRSAGDVNSSDSLKCDSMDTSCSYSVDSSQRRSLDSGYDSCSLHTCRSLMFETSTKDNSLESVSEICRSLKFENPSTKSVGASYLLNTIPSIGEKIDHGKTVKDVKRVLSYFSPQVTKSGVIGPKMGVEKLDIVGNLYNRNISPALKKLLKYLNDEDLETFAGVSKSWKGALLSDVTAKQRRSVFVKTKKRPANKENVLRRSPRKHGQVRGVTGVKQGAFCSLQLRATTPTKSPCKDASGRAPLTRHQLFVKAASALKNDQSLRACPLCSAPSSTDPVQERAVCTSARCAYDFCIACRKPFHGARECTAAVSRRGRTEGCVGSRKSKKNLKRL